MAENNLFSRLTSLFRSGPIVRSKVVAKKSPKVKSSIDLFKKAQGLAYGNAVNAYGQYDRMARYADFSEMEYTPEIASALDIYSHECTSVDEKGSVLSIYSENEKVKDRLIELFSDVLNIDFNLTSWARNLCKYGDFFLFIDVSTDGGISNVFPIPVNEIEREEGFDPDDPMAVRYRWVTQGNQILENWQVGHFRVLGNDAFLPYGSSILESARRIWRQLILVEDAMLVYRVVRSPERRVFKIDVGNVPPEDIPAYMESAKASLKSSQVVDKNTGRVDLRYNPLSVDEDYFLPVRGGESGTDVDTLAGGTNTTAIEDVEYIQKKLFAALKIPRAYLGYDEMISSKATLAQEDIRFSRTINSIQRVIISELNKIAIIHLFSVGFESSELLNFQLHLSNPSTIAQQQKLELYRTKFEIAAQAPEGMLSRDYIRKNVLDLTPSEIDQIERQKEEDKVRDLEVESLALPEEEGEGGGLTGLAAAIGGEELEASPEETEGEEPVEIASVVRNSLMPIMSETDLEEEDFEFEEGQDDPVKPSSKISQRKIYNRKRLRHSGRRALHTPDFNSMVKPEKDVYDIKGMKASLRPSKVSFVPESSLTSLDLFYDKKIKEHARMTSQISSTLKSLENNISIKRGKQLIAEGLEPKWDEKEDEQSS